MVLWVIIILFLAMSAVEIVSLKKEKRRKEIIVYIAVLIPGIVILALLAFGVKIPDFHDDIGRIVAAIVGE